VSDSHQTPSDEGIVPALHVVRADDIRRSSGVRGPFFPQVEMEFARVTDRWAVGRPGDVFVVWPCVACGGYGPDRRKCIRAGADPIDCCSETPSRPTTQRLKLDSALSRGVSRDDDGWNETWTEYSSSYQEAYDTCSVEQKDEIRVSLILLGQHCLERWAARIADALGIPEDMWFCDAQSHGVLICGDDDEILGMAIDFGSSPSSVGLTWTAVVAHGSDPHPLPDYRTALLAASEFLITANY